MQFKEVVGQQLIKQKLISTVKKGRVSHAQLFLGPEGSGSLPLAIAYAQYIACTSRLEDDSCGLCPACHKYQQLVHPDLHFSYPFFAKHKTDTASSFIQQWRTALSSSYYLSFHRWRSRLDAENKQANINTVECHQIIKDLTYKPFESTYKILILWLPEYLGKDGNTLLKILEEPPPQTLFLLVAENPDKILNTILSRTQLIRIPALTKADILTYLIHKKKLVVAQASEIASLSEGNLAFALDLLEKRTHNYHDYLLNWLRMCFANDGIKIINSIETFVKLGRENQKYLLRYALSFVRACSIMLSGAYNLIQLSEKEQVSVRKITNSVLDLTMVEPLATLFEQAHDSVERNANPKILFLDVSLQLVKMLKYKETPKNTYPL